MDVNVAAISDAIVLRFGERNVRALRIVVLALLIGVAAWVLIANLDLTVNGLLVGCIYALGAVGLALVYGNMHFPNVAQGDYMTLGAFIALATMTMWLPETWSGNSVGPFTFSYTLFVALPLGVAIVAAAAVIIDRIVYRPMRGRGAQTGALTLASLGVAIALRGLIQYVWGTEVQNYPRVSKKFLTWDVEPLNVVVRIPPDMVFVAIAAISLTCGIYLFLRFTKRGKSMRAAADNEDLARISGIDVVRTNAWTWAIAGGMAGAAGILFAAGQGQLLTISGWKILIPMFAAVVAGGIGNPYGAFAGAIFIGVVGEVSTAWLQPTYKPAVFFAAILVILLIRPRGIFGASRN